MRTAASGASTPSPPRPRKRTPCAHRLARFAGLAVVTEKIADADWLAMALSGLPPIRAGRFFVFGVHDRGRAPVNAVQLRIEAGAAFGTGHMGLPWAACSPSTGS